MPRKPNPYIAGPPVSGPHFYGREDIFRFVQDTFSSPRQNVVVLWGQRRMGKTSVLHELSSRLSPEFHLIFFDLEDKTQQKLNEVLYDLAREITGSLNLDSPLRDDFLRDDNYFHKRFLPQVYQDLRPKRLLLMFDEFDVLDMPEEELARDVAVRAFFPYLRRRLLHDRQLAFVFVVGRRLDELDKLLKSIFKMAKTAPVSFLEETEARRLVVEPASDVLEYEEQAVGRITSITAGHPYLIQLICSELFNYRETGRSHVTADDVEAMVDRAIVSGEGGLTWLWDSLPPAERSVLSVVAHAAKGGHGATRDEINRTLKDFRVQFSGLELIRAPDNLVRWELLRRTAEGYEFVVELLQRWILREHSLEQIWRDLESASPRAIQFYELADKAHKASELDEAIRLYERALVTNPNHVLAQLGLAQARLEQGKIEEAIIEYEQAYRLHEILARDGLVAALQKRADVFEEEDRVGEADKQYKDILEVASNDQRVVEWVANRWITRGRKYLAENHYREAVVEYGKAADLKVPSAQEELITARQAWAKALERDGKANEADQQHEVLLSLAPDDAKVREWIASSLIERGDRYLEEGRYDEALKTYDQAEDTQTEKQQILAQRRHRLELASDYDKAMEAHKSEEWGTAWERWTELCRKAPDYRGRDGKGKKVAELLKEALDKREKVAERRWKLLPLLGGLAVVFIVLIIGLRIGSPLLGPPSPTPAPIVGTSVTPGMPIVMPPTNTVTLTPSPTATATPTPTPLPTATATPTPTLTPTPSPTATATPTFTPSPTATATPTVTPLPMPIVDVDIDPGNNEIIYVVAKGEGIYKTTDGGHRWQLVNASPNVESLTLGLANPQTVLAAGDRFILRSNDGGATWQSPIEIRDQRTTQLLRWAVHVLAVASSDDKIVYAGTDEGVYRSDDGGVNWGLRMRGMGGRPIYTLAVASGDGQLVYAAGRGAEIWRTLDGGNFWRQLPYSGGMQEVYALAFHPVSDYKKNRLYIGADNSTVAVSVDGGCNWRPIMLGEEKPFYLRVPLKISAVTILDFRDSGTVLLAATGDRENLFRNGVYKSTDNGRSWWPVNNGLPTDSSGTYAVHSIAVDAQNNQTVYAGTFCGLHKSTDGGESWTRIP